MQQLTKLDALISQTMTILAQGQSHSALDQSEEALRCYSVARQLTGQIKRAEVIRAFTAAGQQEERTA